MDLVDAQQARRILDRLVGYKLSPFVSQKIHRGLSAGRVQSVAVRLVVDREEEIRKFVPEEYWSLDAKFTAPSSKKAFKAAFTGDETGKIKLKTKRRPTRFWQDFRMRNTPCRRSKRNAQTFSGAAVYNLHHAAGRLQKARISG